MEHIIVMMNQIRPMEGKGGEGRERRHGVFEILFEIRKLLITKPQHHVGTSIISSHREDFVLIQSS
jgi:hypothetical protein